MDYQSIERLKVVHVHFLELLEIAFADSGLREHDRVFLACVPASWGREQSQEQEYQRGSCRKIYQMLVLKRGTYRHIEWLV